MYTEQKITNINELRRIYLDVSCFKNKNFTKYIEKNKIALCVSELTLLEVKNEKTYCNIPNEEDVDNLLKNALVLKLNNKILELAKKFMIDNKLPKEQYNDALHIAIAKYYRCYMIIYDKETLKEKRLENYNLQFYIN